MKYFPLYFLLFIIIIFSSYSSKQTKAQIEFKSTTIFFDTVKSGPIIKGEFVFTNTGTAPLIITYVMASDGGTVGEWPKLPIEPGKSDKITLQMITGGRKGFHDKSFPVFSNAEDSMVVLHWKGYISQ